MTLQELLTGQFGVTQTDLRESFITVGTSPVPLLPNDPNRVGFIISNLSANACYIGLRPNTDTTTGLILSAANSLSSSWRDDFNTVGFSRFGVSPSGNSDFYVAEIIMTGNEAPQVGAPGGGA